jgi:uncharacterized membrane protein
MKAKEFLNALDDNAIATAIADAEKRTSGEIRVFVTRSTSEDALKDAEAQFLRLEMDRTELRNSVLIYFAPRSHAFAIVGDRAIHERCGESFWRGITERITPVLKENRFTDAIVQAVHEIGTVLGKEFPWKEGDRNELPNDVARD